MRLWRVSNLSTISFYSSIMVQKNWKAKYRYVYLYSYSSLLFVIFYLHKFLVNFTLFIVLSLMFVSNYLCFLFLIFDFWFLMQIHYFRCWSIWICHWILDSFIFSSFYSYFKGSTDTRCTLYLCYTLSCCCIVTITSRLVSNSY